MAENQGQEKTEQATPKRLADAAKKGQIPRSRELTTMAMTLAGGLGMYMFGDGLALDLTEGMRSGLTLERELLMDSEAGMRAFVEALYAGLASMAPLLILLTLVALMAPAVLGGFSFTPNKIAPDFSRLNPIKGFGRIFAMRGLVELGKALAKFLLIAGIAAAVLWAFFSDYIALATLPLGDALTNMGDILRFGFILLTVALLLIAAVDVPFQMWDHARQLKMTRQEVKDEFKETDGRPEVKGKIRQLQREMAQGRMLEAVPDADVVVTNPSHYAVALKYGNDMEAPVVVAKGRDLMAARIRSLAVGNKVPLFPAPPLARALYFSTEVEQEIPAGLYLGVAQVLAYVFQMDQFRRHGGMEPARPEQFDIPPDMRRNPDGTPIHNGE